MMSVKQTRVLKYSTEPRGFRYTIRKIHMNRYFLPSLGHRQEIKKVKEGIEPCQAWCRATEARTP